ncbi:MAG TPA: FRG domain-containing protein [Bacilli bacterium]|jgi:hypothetical protein|nr:FRG domain-containing protein [Bacilli bacterium]
MKEIIENISDYISIISEFNRETIHRRDISVSSINFYRGQSDYDWGLTPRLYRENLLDKESILISEFLRVAPNEFQQMEYFDILVKMQHYGLPTRLLDTTLNPLVALFFACQGDKQKFKDGSVALIPNLPVFKPDSSAISLIMKYLFEYSGYKLDIQEFTQDVITSKELLSAHSMRYRSIEDVLHTLSKVPFYAVLPTLNNQRILNQDGAFFLFGMKVKNVEKSNNPGTFNKMYYEFGPIEYDNVVEKIWPKSKLLRIPSSKKEFLLEELDYLGITKNRMFPELEYQSEYITNLIKKQK